MNVTDKSCTGGVHVRLETGLDTLDVHPGLDTAVAVHPLYAAVEPINLLADGLHQPDHHSRYKLLSNPADLATLVLIEIEGARVVPHPVVENVNCDNRAQDFEQSKYEFVYHLFLNLNKNIFGD